MAVLITNASVASTHLDAYRKYLKLAIRDTDIRVTEGNAEYLAKAARDFELLQVRIVSAKQDHPEVADDSFVAEILAEVAALPPKPATVPEAKLKTKAKKPADKPEPKETTPRISGGLLKSERQVLVVLSATKGRGGMTRRQIADRLIATGEKLVGGRIAAETKTYTGLIEKGFVEETTPESDSGVAKPVYVITPAGRAASRAAK